MKAILSIVIGIIILTSCTQKIDKPEELPLARVYDKYLFVSDLENIIPQNLTEIDSITLLKDYIEKWVQKQLILNQAKENLSEEEKDVDKQINDYRSSLLIFKYEQNLIQQKLDTNITKADVENYYANNASNFILNENLAKGIFLQIPKTAPDIWKVRRWYKSDQEKHIKELDAYCYQYAKQVDYFDNVWLKFDGIVEALPELYSSPKNILRYRRNIEVSDSMYYYFVRITDYRLEGTVAPIEYVTNDIKSILLNKRKIQYINRLEAEIYNDALNRGNFNIY
jgi:hypothetical protein